MHASANDDCDFLFPQRKGDTMWLREAFPAKSGTFLASGFEGQMVLIHSRYDSLLMLLLIFTNIFFGSYPSIF